jgi:hypothetical protein
MPDITNPATRRATRGSSSESTLRHRTLGTRPTISGSSIIDPYTGLAFTKIAGVNRGTWGEDRIGDGPLLVTQGGNLVRNVFRIDGDYATPGTNSLDVEAYGFTNKANLTQYIAQIRDDSDAGVWSIISVDSQCVQDGTQTGQPAYCDPGGIFNGDVNNPGANFVNDTGRAGRHIAILKAMILATWEIDRIFAYEPLPEPLNGRSAAYAPAVLAFYRACFAMKDTIDPQRRIPFVIGPRDGYEMLNIDESFLSERTDAIYTYDALNGKSKEAALSSWDANALVPLTMRNTRNVPVYCNQLGCNTVDDPNQNAMRAVMFWHRAWNIPYTWWQNCQNTSNTGAFALYANAGGGTPGTRIPKPASIAAFTYCNTLDLATLETAAVAAATAAGGVLFYVKTDLSNVKQDSAGTTAVTAAGDPVGLVNPVVGSGLTLSQATAGARPTLVRLTAAGGATNRYGLQFDGVDDVLSGSVPYFASGDDTSVVVAGKATDTATIRVALHVGNGTANARYPFLALQATDPGTASWRGDDTVLSSCDDSISLSDRPMVFSASKIGVTKRLLVNGNVLGAPVVTTAVGAISSFTRMRVGSSTTAGSWWLGSMALIYVGKTMTDTQRQSIERFGAYLIGAAYQV